MEKLISIEQLKPGNKFICIVGDEITGYDFLCIYPINDQYILALNNLTQHIDKIYIPYLLNGNYYLGNYDYDFCDSMLIEYHKKCISYIEQRIESRKLKAQYENTVADATGVDMQKIVAQSTLEGAVNHTSGK